MKINLSKRVLAVICISALVLSAINTYIVFDLNRALQNATKDLDYDYMIFQDGSLFVARNQATGAFDFSSTNASLVLNQAINKATKIYLGAGNYTLTSDIQVYNKKNAKIVSDGACIIGNGKKLIVKGDDYTYSQNNLLSGLTIINGTVRIENSFRTTVSNMLFENCLTALEFANTKNWSEGTKIEDCHFINSTTSIVFKTPRPANATTGSYSSTEIRRCYLNLPDNSVGINVERDAELSDSQIQNVRMWMGENGFMRNQTGLLVDGSMHQTLLFGVVFESFATYPDELYAIELGANSVTPPILAGGVSFLGKLTAKIHNPYHYKWVYGSGSIFRQEENIQVGLSGQYGIPVEIKRDPLTIVSFNPRIEVQGSFSLNEKITVRVLLEFVDNTSSSITKSFDNSTVLWLNDDDILQLYPSQNIILRILVDATADSASTDAGVIVSVYGIVT